MRIMKGRSSNPTYHVIQDVKKNGKRSTEIIENLGSASEICEKYHVTDADAWANGYIAKKRAEVKESKHDVLIKFNKDALINTDTACL